MPVADVPVMQDQGILLSEDIVAIEQASVDMLLKAAPLPQSVTEEKAVVRGDDILHKLSDKPYWLQIEEAERLGLGTKKYEIIES
jgi:hypothetical protein